MYVACFYTSFSSIFSRRGNCKKASLGLVCEIGLRCRTYYVLCGSVLSVWTKVEGVLASVSGTNVKMQIVRLRTEDGQRIVGKHHCYFGGGERLTSYPVFFTSDIRDLLSPLCSSSEHRTCYSAVFGFKLRIIWLPLFKEMGLQAGTMVACT